MNIDASLLLVLGSFRDMRVTLKFVKFVGGFGLDASDGWAQQLFVK